LTVITCKLLLWVYFIHAWNILFHPFNVTFFDWWSQNTKLENYLQNDENNMCKVLFSISLFNNSYKFYLLWGDFGRKGYVMYVSGQTRKKHNHVFYPEFFLDFFFLHCDNHVSWLELHIIEAVWDTCVILCSQVSAGMSPLYMNSCQDIHIRHFPQVILKLSNYSTLFTLFHHRYQNTLLICNADDKHQSEKKIKHNRKCKKMDRAKTWEEHVHVTYRYTQLTTCNHMT